MAMKMHGPEKEQEWLISGDKSTGRESGHVQRSCKPGSRENPDQHFSVRASGQSCTGWNVYQGRPEDY